jgi:O-methyltransferase
VDGAPPSKPNEKPDIPRFNAIKSLLLNGKVGHFLPETILNFFSAFLWLLRLSRWIRSHNCKVTVESRFALYERVSARVGQHESFDYLEFGVHKGTSIQWWLDHVSNPQASFRGFDVFTGLPEDWGRTPRGTFDCQGMPPAITDPRLTFCKGLFQQTLPLFIRDHLLSNRKRLIVHLDADLYSSTLYVLTSLGNLLRKGDMLIFDEFGSMRNSAHEFRAFFDYCSAFKPTFSLIGATRHFKQVAVELT